MNPRRIKLHVDAYTEKNKRELEISNIVAHIQGMYFLEAINSTIGNMFAKKGQSIKYPEKPYELGNSSHELTEEEIQSQRDLFVARYYAMQTNFQLTHSKEDD